MSNKFKTADKYKSISKQILAPNKVVAQCYYKLHPGYLNNKQMTKHKCLEKKCRWIALNPAHPLNITCQSKQKMTNYLTLLWKLRESRLITLDMYSYYHKRDFSLMQEFYNLDNWQNKLNKYKRNKKLKKKIIQILRAPFDKIIRAYRKHKWLSKQNKLRETN